MRKGMRLTSALVLVILASLQNLTAESATRFQKELKDSAEDAVSKESSGGFDGLNQRLVWNDISIEEIMQIAEEEIERTSKEAVKEVLKDVGSELSYWKERSDLYEVQNEQLKYEFEQYKKQRRFETLKGALWGSGITAVVLGVVSIFAMCGR